MTETLGASLDPLRALRPLPVVPLPGSGHRHARQQGR